MTERIEWPQVTYRVGFPFWKLAARAGLPLAVRVFVHYDPEVRSYWASSPDLKGLVVTGNSLDELLREAMAGMDALLDIELHGRRAHAVPRLSFTPAALSAA